MPDTSNETARAELKITAEEARHVASLLRYAISLNTTAGLVSPTERRLATSTYRAAELAALVLEGLALQDAVEVADKTWTGSLEADHSHALDLLQRERDNLRQAMSSYLSPEQIVEYLEVPQDEFLQLVRPNSLSKAETGEAEPAP